MQPTSPSLARRPGWTLPYFAVLGLLAFIPLNSTLLGRAYYHFLGMNALGNGNPVSWAIAWRGLFLATLLLPILILMVSSPPAGRRPLSYTFMRAGLWLWVMGAVMSTASHLQPEVVLELLCGLASGLAVFYAVRNGAGRRMKAAFWVLAVGGDLLALELFIGFYTTWGLPTLANIMAHHYVETDAWVAVSPLANPDMTALFFGVLCCPCLVAVLGRTVSKQTRILAWITLGASTAAIIVCMSRTALVIYLISWMLASAFARSRRNLALCALLLVGTGLYLSSQSSTGFASFFLDAVTYNGAADGSAAARLDSMRTGLQTFSDNPLLGVGISQSFLSVERESRTHELLIWQADEIGVLGLAGVLLLTGACLARMAMLIREGTAEREFLFLLGPGVFFLRGLVSDITLNSNVVNSWVCLVFALLALAEIQAIAGGLPQRAFRAIPRRQVAARGGEPRRASPAPATVGEGAPRAW